MNLFWIIRDKITVKSEKHHLFIFRKLENLSIKCDLICENFAYKLPLNDKRDFIKMNLHPDDEIFKTKHWKKKCRQKQMSKMRVPYLLSLFFLN